MKGLSCCVGCCTPRLSIFWATSKAEGRASFFPTLSPFWCPDHLSMMLSGFLVVWCLNELHLAGMLCGHNHSLTHMSEKRPQAPKATLYLRFSPWEGPYPTLHKARSLVTNSEPQSRILVAPPALCCSYLK